MTSPAHATDTGTPTGGADSATTAATSPALGPVPADTTSAVADQPAPEVETIEVASGDGLVETISVGVYREKATGRVHYASPHSKATQDRLAAGQWVDASADVEDDDAEPFDPTTALVRDVIAHLEEHATDEAEVQRVKDAEAAGENRRTIAAWSPAPADD